MMFGRRALQGVARLVAADGQLRAELDRRLRQHPLDLTA
jgi:hypothetical protein